MPDRAAEAADSSIMVMGGKLGISRTTLDEIRTEIASF
jgi:hypothetical protein